MNTSKIISYCLFNTMIISCKKDDSAGCGSVILCLIADNIQYITIAHSVDEAKSERGTKINGSASQTNNSTIENTVMVIMPLIAYLRRLYQG